MRVCSGKLTRGMRVKVPRTGKTMALAAPQFFFAQDRSLAEEAYAGDVVGIPNRLNTGSTRGKCPPVPRSVQRAAGFSETSTTREASSGS